METSTYQSSLAQLAALCEDCSFVTTNCANAAALLFDTLPDLNWAGFYLMANGALQLGPFCGKPACLRIPLGKGVCGAAAMQRKTLVVPDVHQFPGHIACDCASNSEIVVPIVKNDVLYGVLDIDSPIKNRFDDADAEYLQRFVDILLAACDWNYYQMR